MHSDKSSFTDSCRNVSITINTEWANSTEGCWDTCTVYALLGKAGEIHAFFGKAGEIHAFFGKAGEIHAIFGKAGEIHAIFGKAGEIHAFFGKPGETHAFFGKPGEIHAIFGKAGEIHAFFGKAGEIHAFFGKAGEIHAFSGKAGEIHDFSERLVRYMHFSERLVRYMHFLETFECFATPLWKKTEYNKRKNRLVSRQSTSTILIYWTYLYWVGLLHVQFNVRFLLWLRVKKESKIGKYEDKYIINSMYIRYHSKKQLSHPQSRHLILWKSYSVF